MKQFMCEIKGKQGFGAPFAPRPPAATLPGLASVSSGFHPAQALGGYPAAPSMFRSGSPLGPVSKESRQTYF